MVTGKSKDFLTELVKSLGHKPCHTGTHQLLHFPFHRVLKLCKFSFQILISVSLSGWIIMGEKYNVKWTTFPDHLIAAFKDLGEDGHFADVTLVSDDQVQIPAHKFVLSACSPVLKTFLVNNPHSHPLLYLRGVKQAEMQALLKFMYFGETNIYADRINDFVNVAKDLEVKEISEGQREDPHVEKNKKSSEHAAANNKSILPEPVESSAKKEHLDLQEIKITPNDAQMKIKNEPKLLTTTERNQAASAVKSEHDPNTSGIEKELEDATKIQKELEEVIAKSGMPVAGGEMKSDPHLPRLEKYPDDEARIQKELEEVVAASRRENAAKFKSSFAYTCFECGFGCNSRHGLAKHKASEHNVGEEQQKTLKIKPKRAKAGTPKVAKKKLASSETSKL